ncbi:hypothetical protein [Streptomyces cyaneochromogenes]|uniref:hypothetical protein n=1 Tax=Streptomyces cyaneochromogenes TaxID=2496836 RepID=UPI00158DFA68|nr:hypothetical protein [Streptomyces cyaneochromogenes]
MTAKPQQAAAICFNVSRQETVKTFVSCILGELGLRGRVQVGRVRPPAGGGLVI